MNNNLIETIEQERPRLLGWISRRTNREEAEDILQDVALRSLINLNSLEGVQDLTVWLWRSARNAVIDAWRKRTRRKVAGEQDAPDDFSELIDRSMESVHDSLEKRELLEALASAITELPAQQRDVIVAQCLDGETFQAMAARTGISADTLAARKRYALERLRRSLSEGGWD